MSNRLFEFFNKTSIPTNQKSLPQINSVMANTYVSAPINFSRTPEYLMGLNKGYVYTCNKINSQTVASVPLHLYANQKSTKLGKWVETSKISKKQFKHIKETQFKYANVTENDIVEIVSHPFLDLINTVSTSLDNFTLFEITENYLGLIGNCYWLLKKDKDGLPIEIEVLPSEFVNVMLDEQSNIVGYRYQVQGMGVFKEYNVSDIVHLKNPVAGSFKRNNISMFPKTSIYGLGHLEACIDSVELMNSIETYEKALFDNNCRPDFVVKYKNGQLLDEKFKKLSTQWKQIFRGARNAGKVAILDQDFDIINLGFSPKDLSYIEGKKWLRTSITNAFGVHENFISVENANRASSEMSIEQYYRFTILPKLRRIQECLNTSIVKLYDDNLFVSFEDPVPENAEAVVKKETSDLQNGILSINEIRENRGLVLLEGDEYELPHKNGYTTNVNPIEEVPLNEEDK